MNYYPLEEGFWSEYDVDSIVHLDADDAFLVDTAIRSYHFKIREQIDTSFTDGQGQKAFVVVRYRRDNDTMPWEFTAVWTAKLTSSSLERVEDNRRYVRLSFPFVLHSHWNGNAYNDLEEEDYSYDDLYASKQFGTIVVDSTVTVIQDDFVSNINRILKKEIYGNQAGLLYKQIDSVGTANTGSGEVILSGLEYQQTVTGYSH